MESSQFSDSQPKYDAIEQMDTRGATCDTFRVKLYGKLHFLKRLKPEYAGDIRYQEALRKEFETGYRLEHPGLVRYLSLEKDAILMEYVDGETLSERLTTHPDYFKNRKHTDKFVRQLLDALGYLHSHQVLHLDLKPDNILLTRINDDVKLIDLGFCYTDTFEDTQGYTNAFAAPEQQSTVNGKLSTKTDIYAFGKVLELLPRPYIYNKVIVRCTVEQPEGRYQSVEEILYDINRRKRFSRYVAAFVAIVTALIACFVFITHHQESSPVKQEAPTDSVAPIPKDSVAPSEENPGGRSRDSVHQNHGPVPMILQPKDSFLQPKDSISQSKDSISQSKVVPVSELKPQLPEKDDRTRFMEDIERMMDKAYRSTISCFRDSVFPPPIPTPGNAWADASTGFHNQTIQIGDRLIKKYPSIPETTIRQETEMRFQSLVSYVFNQMRENAK